MDQVKSEPDALKTTVAITGVIALSDEDGDRLDVTNKALSTSLMELSVLSNNQDMPAPERVSRLLALHEPVMTCLNTLYSIVTTSASELTSPKFISQAQALLADVRKFKERVATSFSTFEKLDDAKKAQMALECSQETSNGVLTVLEKVMELFAVSDHATIAAIDDACDRASECVRSIQSEFIEGRSPQQIRSAFSIDPTRTKALVDASQTFIVHYTTCLRAFANRQDVIIQPDAKRELQDGMTMLQAAGPRLLNIAQGNETDNGEAATITRFLQHAKDLVRKVPAFSARVLAEFVDGSALRIAHANLSDAVKAGSANSIGETARKYAIEVSKIVAQCRAMGVDPVECDMVQAALADVLRLAKQAALSGSEEDYKKFLAALEYLTQLTENLPKKFTRKLYDESTSVFDAARNMSKGALLDFVKTMQ